jgi:protein-S-isoprenylcysteine O-methyltransferase Ste14
MAIGTAIFLVGVLFFAIVFRGFRQFLVACAVIAGFGFVVLAIGSSMSANRTPVPWWVFVSLVLVLGLLKAFQYARRRLTPTVTASIDQAPHKTIQKCGTFSYVWNVWSAARNAPGVDLKALDRDLAKTLAEAKQEN